MKKLPDCDWEFIQEDAKTDNACKRELQEVVVDE